MRSTITITVVCVLYYILILESRIMYILHTHFYFYFSILARPGINLFWLLPLLVLLLILTINGTPERLLLSVVVLMC